MIKRTRLSELFLVIVLLLAIPAVSGAEEWGDAQPRFSISPCLPILTMDGVFDLPIIDFTPLHAGYGSWQLTYQPSSDAYLWFYLSAQNYFSSPPADLWNCYNSPVFYFSSSLEEMVLYIPEFYFNQSFYGELNLVYYGVQNGLYYFYAY